MSKNRKRKGAAKRKRTTPSKKRTASAKHQNDVAAGDAVLEPLHGKWTMLIGPSEIAFLGTDVWVYMMIKNREPAMITVPTRREHQEKIAAGSFRLLAVAGEISIGTMEHKPALVEFQFMPRFK
jgi:hypothetical protein